MADSVDNPYPNAPSADEMNTYKHNQHHRAGVFRQEVPADAPYMLVGLKTSALGDDSQRRNLESQIQAIAGVQAAKILVFGTTPTASDVPRDHRIAAVGEIRFKMQPDS